jgi:hypothetical protein
VRSFYWCWGEAKLSFRIPRGRPRAAGKPETKVMYDLFHRDGNWTAAQKPGLRGTPSISVVVESTELSVCSNVFFSSFSPDHLDSETSVVFFFGVQFCDVAKMAIIHRKI